MLSSTQSQRDALSTVWRPLTGQALRCVQVDVTAAEELAKPDVVPNIDRDAERTAHSAATVINSALQHMGLGPDPWKGIVAGVGRLKPFVQAGSRAR